MTICLIGLYLTSNRREQELLPSALSYPTNKVETQTTKSLATKRELILENQHQLATKDSKRSVVALVAMNTIESLVKEVVREAMEDKHRLSGDNRTPLHMDHKAVTGDTAHALPDNKLEDWSGLQSMIADFVCSHTQCLYQLYSTRHKKILLLLVKVFIVYLRSTHCAILE